jgi:CxxC motif-containing protein (DUF1111 family)
MKCSQPYWYCTVLFLALVPAGVRALTWTRPQPRDLDPGAVETGQMLFVHEWKPNDPLANGGDGLGPVFNAKSCVACHGSPSVGGGSGREHNVTLFTVTSTVVSGGFLSETRTGLVHAKAVKKEYQETLAKVDPSLPEIAQPELARFNNRRLGGVSFGFDFSTPNNVILSQRNTPALYGAKLIDELSDRVILANEKQQRLQWGLAPPSTEQLPVGRAMRLPDGRIGKFGWKGQSASLLEFVQAACANELGLGNPANAQPKPLGRADYVTKGLDLTTEQCQQMTDFILALARPVERAPADDAARVKAEAGKALFAKVGCADCHTPTLGSVEGLYSDLLLHRMGPDLQGGGFYYGSPVPAAVAATGSGPFADEWRTPPLWGVADSAPYLHDGRAETLEEAIQLHGGQGARAASAFARLSQAEQMQLIAFLKSLRAP